MSFFDLFRDPEEIKREELREELQELHNEGQDHGAHMNTFEYCLWSSVNSALTTMTQGEEAAAAYDAGCRNGRDNRPQD